MAPSVEYIEQAFQDARDGHAARAAVLRRRHPDDVRQDALARGHAHHVAVHAVGPAGVGRRAAHRGARGVRRPHGRLLRRGRAQLQGLDPAPRRGRALRDGARVRPDRRQHLPRRAVARAAVPHAAGSRLRRLPHADQGALQRQLGHPRRWRRLRHPGLPGGQGRASPTARRLKQPPAAAGSDRTGPRIGDPTERDRAAPCSRRARWRSSGPASDPMSFGAAAAHRGDARRPRDHGRPRQPALRQLAGAASCRRPSLPGPRRPRRPGDARAYPTVRSRSS